MKYNDTKLYTLFCKFTLSVWRLTVKPNVPAHSYKRTMIILLPCSSWIMLLFTFLLWLLVDF